METSTQNTILAGISLAISVGGMILGIINHKRIVSKCCGRQADVSLDIQDTRGLSYSPKSPVRLDKTKDNKDSRDSKDSKDSKEDKISVV